MSFMIKSILSKVVLGVIEGILYYVVFALIVPRIIEASLGKIPVPAQWVTWSPYMFFLLGFFIALGVIASIVKEPLAIIFEALLTIVGLLLVVSVLGTGIFRESVNIGGAIWGFELDFRILVICILGFSIIYSITRFFERLVKIED